MSDRNDFKPDSIAALAAVVSLLVIAKTNSGQARRVADYLPAWRNAEEKRGFTCSGTAKRVKLGYPPTHRMMTSRSKCRPANSSSMLLRLPKVGPQLPKDHCTGSTPYLHQSQSDELESRTARTRSAVPKAPRVQIVYGCNEATYADRSTMSSFVSFITTGFIVIAFFPSRVPLLKS